MLDGNLRTERRDHGNGILVPGWIVKLIIPIFASATGALGTLTVNAQQETNDNQAAVREACQEVNELRETLREIILISAADEGPRNPREQTQLTEFLAALRARDCND